MEEKRLKIAMFIDTYFPMIDGVAMVVDNFAKRIQKYADVTVFCPQVDKNFIDEYNYKVVRCKAIKFFFYDYVVPCPKLDKKFKKYLKENKFDIVHINSPFALGKIGVKYAKKNNIPVVATLHSQYKQDLKKALKLNFLTKFFLASLMKVFNSCDECWGVNEGIRKLYVEEYGLTTKNKVRRNACDFLPFEDKIGARKYLEETYGVKENEKIFLFVGRINFIKNIPFIIDALSILNEKNYPFKMIFIGNGADKPALEKLIEEKGLSDKVVLAGEVKDRKLLEKIYSGGDLFLFPSLYDANSLVQIEAASQGLPTLFIREAKTASSCTENVNAFMSDNDAKKYAEKIESIFEDEQLYKEVSKNAQTQLYVKWDDCAEELLDDYKRFIK